MKIIINENQLKLITEQEGIGDFFEKIHNRYPDSVYILEFLKKFIEKSGCKKIGFYKYSIGVSGTSFFDGVGISEKSLFLNFSKFLYILFHEIAHQYQYKKYGIDKMYACYTGDESVEDGAKFMMYVEKIADEFAIRKIREVKNLFKDKLNIKEIDFKVYDKIELEHFINLINMFIEKLKEKGYKNKNEISEILFNYIKNEINVIPESKKE